MDFSDLLLRLLNAKLDIGAPASCGGRSSATASVWQAHCWACGAESRPGRSASWATSCCSRCSSAGCSTPRRTSICGARPAARSSSSSSASTAGCAGTSSASAPAEAASASSPGGPARAAGSSCWSARSCSGSVFYFILKALHSWGPAADAWILTGSILATYGMARGWVEFWLIWIAVDLVGVPLLLAAGYYPSAIMYIVYGGVLRGRVHVLVADRAQPAGAGPEPVAGRPGDRDGRLTADRPLSWRGVQRDEPRRSSEDPSTSPVRRAHGQGCSSGAGSSTVARVDAACTRSARRSSRRQPRSGWPPSTSPRTRRPGDQPAALPPAGHDAGPRSRPRGRLRASLDDGRS